VHLPAIEPRGAICADLRVAGRELRVVGMHLDERTNYPLTLSVVPGDELLLKMLTTNAPSVNELRPELPPELGPIIAKALAKDAAERQQSIDELADALVPFAAPTLPEAV